jgi:hypothetical protein
MRTFKKLKEYIIQDEESFEFLLNLKLVDKDLNPVDFRTQDNKDKSRNSFYFPTNKSYLLNNIVQNLLYYVFDNNPKIQKKLMSLHYEERKDLANTTMEDSYSRLLHTFSTFVQEGQKVISIKNKELLEQFENTSVKNLKFQDFNIFLDSFFFSLEKKFGNTYVDGFFVQNENDCFEIIFLIKRDTENANELMNACLYKKYSIEGALERALLELNEHCVDKLNNITQEGLKNTIQDRMIREEKDDTDILEYSFNLLINVLMFFNTQRKKENPHYEIKEDNKTFSNFPKKDRYLTAKVSSSNYYYYLSSNSKQNKEFQVSQKERKIKNMFIVSGHYRKQPIGSREEVEYKTIWIEPFLKGEGVIENKIKNTIIK